MDQGASKQNDTVMAAVATIPVVGLIMYFGMKDMSDYVKHFAKQSIGLLILLVVQIVLWFASALLSFVFGIGVIIGCLNFLLSIVSFVLWVVLLIYALQGTKWSIPVLTDLVNNLLKE